MRATSKTKEDGGSKLFKKTSLGGGEKEDHPACFPYACARGGRNCSNKACLGETDQVLKHGPMVGERGSRRPGKQQIKAPHARGGAEKCPWEKSWSGGKMHGAPYGEKRVKGNDRLFGGRTSKKQKKGGTKSPSPARKGLKNNNGGGENIIGESRSRAVWGEKSSLSSAGGAEKQAFLSRPTSHGERRDER